MGQKGKVPRLGTLIRRLESVLAEIDRREGRSNRSRPYGPASESEIASAEGRLKFKFPPSYREFLRLHNGWDGFNAGDICVLGVSGPAYQRALGTWNDELRMFGKSYRRRGRNHAQELSERSKSDAGVVHLPDHIPCATNYNGDWWVFDTNRRSVDDEYEVARVAHGEDVEDREASFLSFVEDNVRRKQAQLEKLAGSVDAGGKPASTQVSRELDTSRGEAAAGMHGRGGSGKSSAVPGSGNPPEGRPKRRI